MRRYGFHFVLLLLLCYVASIGLLISSWGKSLAVGGTPQANPTIIVDPGHGGFDGGAEGANGAVEKDINLPIAIKVRDLLVLYGFDVIMTRDADIATCDPGLELIRQKKTSDIMNRFKLIEQHPNSIFLSIHQNKYPDGSLSGAQMFYGPETREQSEAIASIMQHNFVTMLQPDNTRQPKPAEDSVYLLFHSPVPSVLIECGFLSNPDEEALLRTDEYQNKIAFVIAGSLMQYIEQAAYPQIEESAAVGAPARRTEFVGKF